MPSLFAHDAVFVVAVVRGLEPQRAVLLVRLAVGHQLVHGGLYPATGVQAALEVVLVKLEVEGLQVFVLLVAQVGHSKLANGIDIVDIAAGGELAVIGLDGLLGQKVVGNVLDVVAVVESLAGGVLGVDGPALVTGLEAFGAQLRAVGQGLDLHAGVVVIKLAVHGPTLGAEQVANGIAQGGLAAVAHVQRARGVGRHKLHQHALAVDRPERQTASALAQHLAHHFLLGSGLQANIDEAGACDLDVASPSAQRRASPTRLSRRVSASGAWVQFERFGQLHGRGAGEVAVGRHLGRFKGGFGTCARRESFQAGGQRLQKFVFDGEHGQILRCPSLIAGRRSGAVNRCVMFALYACKPVGVF